MALETKEILGLDAFGAEAAASGDIDDLLNLACRSVTQGLGATHAKVLEYLADERELLIRAGIGWDNDVVGVARLGADLGSPAGFALQTGRPTIANDLATEQRFRVPQILADHGVRSAVNVIIKHGDAVFGVLEADSRNPREFDDRDVQFLQGYANILALSLSQSMLVQRNAALIQRLDILLNELRHRTKNNNQMLLSMIKLEQRQHEMLEVRQVLDDVASRLNVLNAIDELIVANGNDGKVDLGRYVLSIVNNIFALDAERAKKVRLDTETFELTVDTRRAQAVAMIVNEFLTNSFKYAFIEGQGEVAVKLQKQDDDVFLRLSDNGPGLSPDAKQGMGLNLIEAMIALLKGKHEWSSNHGATLELRFPLEH